MISMGQGQEVPARRLMNQMMHQGRLGAATELPSVAGLRGGAHGPDRRAGPHQRELPLVGDHRVTPQVPHHLSAGAVNSTPTYSIQTNSRPSRSI